MKPEVRKDLNEVGMTSVTRNGKRAKNMEGKVMKGFRGGQFGPMTATCAHQTRKYMKKCLLEDGSIQHFDEMRRSFKNPERCYTFAIPRYGY